MNPINDPNDVSRNIIKYVYQEADMRMINPSMLTVKKPFKPPENKNKKDESKKKKGEEKDNPSSGLFDLF
jgi:hypothetical protein